METPIDAGGLNRAEASFLAAAVRFGDEPDLVEAVESGPARALRARLEAVEPLGDAARGRCAAELEEAARPSGLDDRVRPVLSADEDDHVDALQCLDADALLRAAREFGAYQLAELLRGKNRREVARVAGRFAPAYRSVLLGALRRDRECDRREKIRIREVFVSVSRHVDAFGERVTRLGLYSIACAAGLRYRERIARLADRLSVEVGERLRHYYRLSYGSTRRGLGRQFRRALVDYIGWRHRSGERFGGDVSGGEDD